MLTKKSPALRKLEYLRGGPEAVLYFRHSRIFFEYVQSLKVTCKDEYHFRRIEKVHNDFEKQLLKSQLDRNL